MKINIANPNFEDERKTTFHFYIPVFNADRCQWTGLTLLGIGIFSGRIFIAWISDRK
jgi:hypothetical protein